MIFLQSAACILLFIRYTINAGFFHGPAFAVLLALLCLVFINRILSKKVFIYMVIIIQTALVYLFSFFYIECFFLLPLFVFSLFFRDNVWIKIIISAAVLFPVFMMDIPAILIYAASVITGITVSWAERKTGQIARIKKNEIIKLEKELYETGRKLAAEKEAGISDKNLAVFLERDRIAQKLHDELGHTITGSIMQLDAAEILLRANPEKAGSIISGTKDVLRKGMENIRMSIKSLKPVSSDMGLGLLKKQMNEFMKDNDIRIIFTADEKKCSIIPVKIWELISLNLKEALTNFLKYSDGKEFYFSINILNKIIKIEFRNDGVYGQKIKFGFGLSGMEKRTREAGGSFITDTSNGFSVIMLINIEKKVMQMPDKKDRKCR